jgi:hypothetical protein
MTFRTCSAHVENLTILNFIGTKNIFFSTFQKNLLPPNSYENKLPYRVNVVQIDTQRTYMVVLIHKNYICSTVFRTL